MAEGLLGGILGLSLIHILNVRDQSLAGIGDPRLASRITDLCELQRLTVVGCAMEVHVVGSIGFCESSTEGFFGKHRKRQRITFCRSPNPNRGLHQDNLNNYGLRGERARRRNVGILPNSKATCSAYSVVDE